jgi:hypothetical protein
MRFKKLFRELLEKKVAVFKWIPNTVKRVIGNMEICSKERLGKNNQLLEILKAELIS